MDSSKARKEYLVLTCGPASLQTSLPKGKGADGEMCSDGDDSDDEENQMVSIEANHYVISSAIDLCILLTVALFVIYL